MGRGSERWATVLPASWARLSPLHRRGDALRHDGPHEAQSRVNARQLCRTACGELGCRSCQSKVLACLLRRLIARTP